MNKYKLVGHSYGGGGVHGVGTCESQEMVQQIMNLPYETFKPDAASGVSVGAIIALDMATGKTPAETKKAINEDLPIFFKKYPLYKRWNRKLPTYDDAGINRYLENRYRGWTMDKLEIECFIAAERQSGTKSACKIFDRRDKGVPCWKVARASMAAQTYFDPFEINGEWYLDGGNISNSGAEILRIGMKKAFQCENEEICIIDWRTSSFNNAPLGNPRKFKVEWLVHTLEKMTNGAADKDEVSCAEILGDRYFLFKPCNKNLREIPLDGTNKGQLSDIRFYWRTYTNQVIYPFIDRVESWGIYG